jgi:hypothetical protein
MLGEETLDEAPVGNESTGRFEAAQKEDKLKQKSGVARNLA